MASLVVSWMRMLEEVQASAEERPLPDFEHDEAHFLRVPPQGCRPQLLRASRKAAAVQFISMLCGALAVPM